MKSQDSITVWIVEDEVKHAVDAKEAVLDAAREAGLGADVYWDKTIKWESHLSGPPPAEFRAEFSKRGLPPTIVILDLFGPGGFMEIGRAHV